MHPCIHIPHGPSWPIMGITFTMVFSCEYVQLALMVSPCITIGLANHLSKQRVRCMCGLPGDVSEVQSSFSNLLVTSPTSQLILGPFCRFTYVTAHSPTLLFLHLHHSSFSNPSFPSSTLQTLHLRPLASCPWSDGAM